MLLKCLEVLAHLLNQNLFNLFDVSIIDASFEGIQGLLFSDKNSGINFITYSCYLAPYGLPFLYMSTDFLAHLITQLYVNSEIDMICICGDFNGRTGSLKDVIDDIDSLPQRWEIDDNSPWSWRRFCQFCFRL